jgi:tRNA(Arg) A34 adenosine deaminase TadA
MRKISCLALACLLVLSLAALALSSPEPGPVPAALAAQDEFFMAQALELARQAASQGDEPYGAVLVKDGQVVARATNTIRSERRYSGHAEINVIDDIIRQRGFTYLQDCTLYASTEPCIACSGYILLLKVGAVVYSVPHEYLARRYPQFEAVPAQKIFALGRHQVQMRGPVLREQGENILADYIEARQRKSAK